MLVDHLRERVAQNDNVLVEGLNLSLKLYAVHEIDRNRNMFLAQEIKERILQKLNLVVGHDVGRVRPLMFGVRLRRAASGSPHLSALFVCEKPLMSFLFRSSRDRMEAE